MKDNVERVKQIVCALPNIKQKTAQGSSCAAGKQIVLAGSAWGWLLMQTGLYTKPAPGSATQVILCRLGFVLSSPAAWFQLGYKRGKPIQDSVLYPASPGLLPEAQQLLGLVSPSTHFKLDYKRSEPSQDLLCYKERYISIWVSLLL